MPVEVKRSSGQRLYRKTSRSVFVLLPSDQGRAFAFHDSPINHDVSDIFPARHFIHDVEHDLFEHRTQSARSGSFGDRLMSQGA